MYREIMWTEEAEQHIVRHLVCPTEVTALVNSRPVFVTAGRCGATLIYGCTDAGRYLLVVLAQAADGRWCVVTARDMTRKERHTFWRKEK